MKYCHILIPRILRYSAISSTVGKNFIADPGLQRTLTGDGLATTLASLFGAPANTTYGENTGVLTLSKVYDPFVIRIAAGFVCVLFSNRVDKANITLKVVIGLGVCEVIYEVFLLIKKAIMLGSLLFSFVIVGFLLWAALKMRDLQKAYPNRKYALESTRNTAKKAAAAPKKTIHDRAMINTNPEITPDEKQVENSIQESAVVEEVPDISSAEQQSEDDPTV